MKQIIYFFAITLQTLTQTNTLKNNQKEVVLIAPKLTSPSGTGSYIKNTLNGLTKIGLKFDLFELKKIEFSLLGKPRFGILSQTLFSKFLRIDAKIIHSLSTEVITKNTNIVTVHDIIPFTNRNLYIHSKLDQMAYDMGIGRALKISNLLASTNYGKKMLVEKGGVDEDKIHVIYHSIDHANFFPSERNPFEGENRIKLLMVSDFNPRKRIDKIVETVKENKDYAFYHIGPTQNWTARYRDMKSLAGSAENIFFLGPQSVDTIRNYLSHADLTLYLSDNEGFGLPPIEAAACGSNILVSGIPVFKELLNEIAFFADNESFSISSIESALKSKHSKDSLINFTQKFSVENHAKRLLDFYNSIN